MHGYQHLQTPYVIQWLELLAANLRIQGINLLLTLCNMRACVVKLEGRQVRQSRGVSHTHMTVPIATAHLTQTLTLSYHSGVWPCDCIWSVTSCFTCSCQPAAPNGNEPITSPPWRIWLIDNCAPEPPGERHPRGKWLAIQTYSMIMLLTWSCYSMYICTVVSELLVTIAHCTLRSLTW